MAPPVQTSAQTTRARSIMTLDGYVSRGKAPPNSVRRDHAMLQDFAAYLELRLKSQNLSMLRRIFADFLNEHENTLVPMMQQGCTMITIFPMLRTSAKRRRQAEILLAKPKFHLDARGCVFTYLQYRTATRNMALLKHLLWEFVCHQETSLLAFVERGCEVISVIPFELPQIRPPPPRVEQRESPRAVEAVAEHEQGTKTVAKKTRNRRKRRVPVKEKLPSASVSAPAASVVAESQNVVKEPRKSLRKGVKTRSSAASEVAAVPDDPEIVTRRRRNRGGDPTSGSPSSKDNADKSVPPASSPVAVAVTAPKRGNKTKTSVVPPLQEAAAVAMEQASAVVVISEAEADAAIAPKEIEAVAPEQDTEQTTATESSEQTAGTVASEQTSAPVAPEQTTAAVAPEQATDAVVPEQPTDAVVPEQATAAVAPEQAKVVDALEQTGAALEQAGTVAEPEQVGLASEASQEQPTRKRGRKRKSESELGKSTEKKTHKRGKPVMSEEMVRSQMELSLKVETFVAQSPWETVYGNLSAPFEEEKHLELSRKFRRFWHRHSQAVWERKFWVPLSRKLNVPEFNKRCNRQLTAKNAFESLIIAVYKEFGASFFVKLDTQKPRHPGWWYRGPVVALFALQQLKGEDAMWEYIKNNALKRFPDCRLPIPLASTNSAVLRKCDKRESESMWMVNHPLTADILREIAALNGEQRPCEQMTAV